MFNAFINPAKFILKFNFIVDPSKQMTTIFVSSAIYIEHVQTQAVFDQQNNTIILFQHPTILFHLFI